LLLVVIIFPFQTFAQELHSEVQGVWHAEVKRVVELPSRLIPGTDTPTEVQELHARILEGPREGETVVFENDFVQLAEGDYFFMNYLVDINGAELYSVREPNRLGFLLVLGALFAGAVVLFGGMPGARSLVALAISLSIIVLGLLPLLLAGYPPLPLSVVFGVGIVGLAMAITHGLSRPALAAFLGSGVAVCAAGVLGSIAVSAAKLSGFASDEAVFLNIGTAGVLDIEGLLLAAIIIGALGVLDDISITQASAAEEIYASRKGDISSRELYLRASRIGRAHIGAVVNTLALAYVGAALPLLLLFSLSELPWGMLINQEVLATEIVRTAVGSIALALAVPATTLLSVYLIRRFPTWRPKHHAH
jgi:uncharacterized membrane protein